MTDSVPVSPAAQAIEMPKLWWSPSVGLIRGGDKQPVAHADAVRLVPAPGPDTEREMDADEVQSWAELAEEFAHNAASALRRYRQTQSMSLLQAISETGRDPGSWLTLSEGYDTAAQRIAHLAPILGQAPAPVPGVRSDGDTEQ